MNSAILKTSLKIGLLTALAVLLYEASNVLLFYKFIRLDYYIAIIALAALVTGVVIARRQAPTITHQPDTDPFGQLTNKEMQIFLLMADGKTNKEIAAANFVEISTIKTHINHIYAKLQVSSRKQALALYQNQGASAKSTLYPPPVA